MVPFSVPMGKNLKEKTQTSRRPRQRMPTLAYTVRNGRSIAGSRRQLADALIKASGAGVNRLHSIPEVLLIVPRGDLNATERLVVEEHMAIARATTDSFVSLFSPTYNTIQASSYVGGMICRAYEDHVNTRHEVAQNMGFCSWLEAVIAYWRRHSVVGVDSQHID